MSKSKLHIVFAGGGTAGHLFPGLAVAAELAALANAPRITFAGSGKLMESRLVAKAGFDYIPLPCAPLPRDIRVALRFLSDNLAGYRLARRFLRQEQVDAVVGLGGYVSVPLCRAAAKYGVPLALLEQNVYPGKATRWLASRADVICTAFDKVRQHLSGTARVRVTGNPIRSGFYPRKTNLKKAIDQQRGWQRRLLVLGGSGGSQSLNEFVPKALYKLRERLTGWQIVHQTGARDVGETTQLYRKLALAATVVPFVQNLPAVLRRADLAVSRAGGTTLAELAATGVPAVLIPYPSAADNHQKCNAEVFVATGAARMIDERAADHHLDDALITALADLLNDVESRRAMSSAMLRLARPDAAWQVAMQVHDLACHSLAHRVA